MKARKKSNKIQSRENDGLLWKAAPPVDQISQSCLLGIHNFTLPITMPASHLFWGKDTPCPINRTDVSKMLLHDGIPQM